VPVGSIRPDAPLVKYQIPPGKNTCLSSSMASAMHYCGFEQGAKILYEAGVAADHTGDLVGLIKRMIELARDGTDRVYAPHRIREKQACLLNPAHTCADDPDVLMVVAILSASDGEATHAITMSDGWIFEANLTFALPLTRESLDYCCGGQDTPYVGIHRGYIFRPHQHNSRKRRKKTK